jgi:hypothetical protein
VAGRLRNCRYCRRLLAIMTITFVGTVLIITNRWNPLPKMADWWEAFTALSEPAPAWEARVGGVPELGAVMTGGQVVVASAGYVDAYEEFSGVRLWQHRVHWALPAGDVVVERQRAANADADREPDRGYSVVDPANGTVLWGEREAVAVWAFADRILDLACPGGTDCRLRARAHDGAGRQLWAVALPAGARTITGPQPALVAPRDPAEWFGTAAAGSPPRLPPVIGLKVDGAIQIVDTVDGRLVRAVAPDGRDVRVTVTGERLITTRAEPSDGGCRLRVEAVDYRSGASVWAVDGLDVDTADGAGCEQRRDPLGGQGQLAGERGDGRPTLVAVSDGRSAWTGVAGERVLATDGDLAVIEGADRRTVRVVDLLDGRTVWSDRLGLRPQAAVTRDHVIINDTDEGRLLVLRHVGATPLADLRTKATVVGHGRGGVVIASGRRIGLVHLAR